MTPIWWENMVLFNVQLSPWNTASPGPQYTGRRECGSCFALASGRVLTSKLPRGDAASSSHSSCHIVLFLYLLVCLRRGLTLQLKAACNPLYSLRLALSAQQPSCLGLTSAGIIGTSHHTLPAYFITIFSLPLLFSSLLTPSFLLFFPKW